ncbi:polyisoprenoid-binding protein, partial [cyanobacterium TDX16]
GTYTIDASHTLAGFVVKHLMISKVRGSFSDVSGTIVIAEDPVQSSVEVDIDVASVHTRDEGRDGHLRSPDFFDAEQFPKITFRSTSVAHVDGDRWTVVGDLTIKDVTQSVTLDTTFEGASPKPEALGGGYSIGFSASAKVNREAFGLTWNAPLEGGGVLVGKDVTLEIETEAFEA